jgi:hypothetical protein
MPIPCPIPRPAGIHIILAAWDAISGFYACATTMEILISRLFLIKR